MSHQVLLQLSGVLVIGILAQWLAWMVRLPSILFLLAAGLLAGPVTGWLQPDLLFGDLLLPAVSLSVAVILYEGGLNLRLREIEGARTAFVLLSTLGVAISAVIVTVAAHLILGFPWQVATLLGAILVVTGPTVIGPLLRHLRLGGKAGALLKWEGIVVDPIGATLAVLVFTVMEAGSARAGFGQALGDLFSTLLVASIAGGAAAALLVLAISLFWLPDFLHNPMSLILMIAAFTISNGLQDESGLLAVTLMGIFLANQKRVAIRHVVVFKETLTILLISCLFIVLAARLKPDELRNVGWEHAIFLFVLIVVARPASVLVSTLGSALTWPERIFLSCMAPRGIVAVAVSSVLSLTLVEAGQTRAAEIVPVIFVTVFVTVLLYGLSAAPLARALGLVTANPQGILFVGADAWVRAVAVTLRNAKFNVFLIDTNRENIRLAKMAGLPCLHGSALSEETRERINYSGLGKMMAVTSNIELNTLACIAYAEDFGWKEVYQLSPGASRKDKESVSRDHRGRQLFGEAMSSTVLNEFAGADPKIKSTKLSEEFPFKAFEAEHGVGALPVMVVKSDATLQIRTVDSSVEPRPGETVISIAGSNGTTALSTIADKDAKSNAKPPV